MPRSRTPSKGPRHVTSVGSEDVSDGASYKRMMVDYHLHEDSAAPRGGTARRPAMVFRVFLLLGGAVLLASQVDAASPSWLGPARAD